MTCTCKKCNQKRVIDCLFVKVDVNLHIARQTQLLNSWLREAWKRVSCGQLDMQMYHSLTHSGVDAVRN